MTSLLCGSSFIVVLIAAFVTLALNVSREEPLDEGICVLIFIGILLVINLFTTCKEMS